MPTNDNNFEIPAIFIERKIILYKNRLVSCLVFGRLDLYTYVDTRYLHRIRHHVQKAAENLTFVGLWADSGLETSPGSSDSFSFVSILRRFIKWSSFRVLRSSTLPSARRRRKSCYHRQIKF